MVGGAGAGRAGKGTDGMEGGDQGRAPAAAAEPAVPPDGGAPPEQPAAAGGQQPAPGGPDRATATGTTSPPDAEPTPADTGNGSSPGTNGRAGNGHGSAVDLVAALEAPEPMGRAEAVDPAARVGSGAAPSDRAARAAPSPERGAGDGPAPPAPRSPALAAALRGALAGLASPDAMGEDDLDPFPLSPEARLAEMAQVDLAAAGPLPPAEPATVPASALAPMVPTVVAAPPKAAPRPPVVVDEAIRRFHREIGLIRDEDAPAPAVSAAGEVGLAPAAEGLALAVEAAPAEVLPAPDGGGGSDGGGGLSPPDRGEADGGGGRGRGRRRQPFWAAEDRPMTVVEHLDELRTRLVWSAAAFIIGTAIAFPFAGRILYFTQTNAESFIHRMGSKNLHITIIDGSPMGALFSWIEFAMVLGLFLSGGLIIYEIVAFVMPALTKRERGVLFSYLPPAMGLFLVGISFGVFVFQPVAMRVATTFLSWSQPTYTIAEWNDFVIKYSLYFGLLYELPVLIGIIVRLGFLTPETLSKGRRWAFMGSLIIALMFAPPADFIFTPSLICLPLYGLFEVSIIVARVVYRARLRDMAAEEA